MTSVSVFELRIVVVDDINSELNEKEIQLWSKLTRRLTHKIMTTPPTHSATSCYRGGGSHEDWDHISHQLMIFVEAFRLFTKIPAPQESPFEVSILLKEAVNLVAKELRSDSTSNPKRRWFMPIKG